MGLLILIPSFYLIPILETLNANEERTKAVQRL